MHDEVKEYYGKILEHSGDLKTNACCVDEGMTPHLKAALCKVHDEVLARFYGCGLILPESLEGKTILDLGSGSGRDCYVLAQFVGETGAVVGVDMTEEQLAVANKYLEYHRQAFGYQQSNVKFYQGYLEKLDELALEDGSFDIIVSNCVINLSPDKESVLKHAYRLLKPGGEIYFSDIYADRRVPKHLLDDPVLYGECLSGALYWNDFENLAKRVGFPDPRLVEDRPITIDNPAIEASIGHINFYSATYRLFKVDGLEPACEDYGQAVIYRGGIKDHENIFQFDKHHRIQEGQAFPVCGNTYRMLHASRFRQYFDFVGDGSCHNGIFKGSSSVLPFTVEENPCEKKGGCC